MYIYFISDSKLCENCYHSNQWIRIRSRVFRDKFRSLIKQQSRWVKLLVLGQIKRNEVTGFDNGLWNLNESLLDPDREIAEGETRPAYWTPTCAISWKPIPSDCSRIATGTLRCAEAVRPLRRCTKRTRSVRASPSRRSTTPWARTATRKSGPAAEPSPPITSSIRTTRHLRPTRASTVCNIFTSFSFSLSVYLCLFFYLFLSPQECSCRVAKERQLLSSEVESPFFFFDASSLGNRSCAARISSPKGPKLPLLFSETRCYFGPNY